MMLFALFIAVSLFSVSVRGSYYMETIIDESSSANFMGPANFGGIWVNSLGVVYFAKPSIQGVQTLTPAGNKTVIIGPSSQSTTGADGSATSVQLDGVYSITGDTSGNLYISSSQYFVWKYNQSSGIVSRYAGATPATQGYSGDGGQATAASFSYPRGLFLSSNGVLFVADTGNCRVRTINTTSEIINTFAGNGVNSFGGDSGPATSASLSSPSSVWGSSDGVIYISEIGNNRIRQVDTSGIITTFAGNGNQVYNTDNIPATSASFAVNSMSGDSNGTIFLADFSNFRILGIQSGIIHSIAGDGNNGGVMPAFISSNTSLPQPFYVFPDPVSGTVFFTGKATANVIVSALPTAAPTMTPTYTQTNTPTYNPTVHPTDTPTVTPTSAPSSHPTETPTFTPTSAPSFTLTEMPTVAPTFSPSVLPTETPTTTPTSAPSFHPTETPTMTPTSAPSFHPTDTPTITPSTVPSFRPSSSPTNSTLNSNSHSNERMSDLHIFYATFFPAFFVLCCILLGVLVYVSCYANGNVKNNETEQGKNVYEKVGGEGNGVVVRKERYYEVWI